MAVQIPGGVVLIQDRTGSALLSAPCTVTQRVSPRNYPEYLALAVALHLTGDRRPLQPTGQQREPKSAGRGAVCTQRGGGAGRAGSGRRRDRREAPREVSTGVQQYGLACSQAQWAFHYS